MLSACKNSVLVMSFLIHAHAYADGFELVIDVLRARPDLGYVTLSLFSSTGDFLVKPVIEKTTKVNDAGQATFVLREIPTGRYAVSVFYGQNGNDEPDTGLLGILKELVGFSNNARGYFGPPSFDKAAFDLLAPTRQVIQLQRAIE